MGNQASSGPGPAARQHSAPAGTPPSAPVTRVVSAAHVAPGAETRDPSGPVTLDTCATRLRRLSGDSGDKRLESPPSITVAEQQAPLCPAEERYTAPSQAAARPRARTTNHVLAARSRARHVPTVFRLSRSPGAEAVYLAGTMTGWRCVKMSRPEGEAAWVHIHDTLEGEHHYKFLVDGLWCVEEAEPTLEAEDKVWNVMEVKKTDFEVFEALACDSFSLKMSEKNKLENKFNSDSWCQECPSFEKLDTRLRTPPSLPPHLLQVILNRDLSYQPDPVLLEEPSHVMLNHLYAQAIRDDLLVLSSTQRFRKKYVTTLLYKPI